MSVKTEILKALKGSSDDTSFTRHAKGAGHASGFPIKALKYFSVFLLTFFTLITLNLRVAEADTVILRPDAITVDPGDWVFLGASTINDQSDGSYTYPQAPAQTTFTTSLSNDAAYLDKTIISVTIWVRASELVSDGNDTINWGPTGYLGTAVDVGTTITNYSHAAIDALEVDVNYFWAAPGSENENHLIYEVWVVVEYDSRPIVQAVGASVEFIDIPPSYVPGSFTISAWIDEPDDIVTSCEICSAEDGTCDDSPSQEWFPNGTVSSLGGGLWECLSGNISYPDGTIRTLNIRATSSLGSGGGGTGTGTPIVRTVDALAPNLSFSTPATGAYFKDGDTIAVDVFASDNYSGITDGADCNAKIADGTGSFTGSVTYIGSCIGNLTLKNSSGLSEGLNDLTVEVADNVNNSASLGRSINIDNTAPTDGTLTATAMASDTIDLSSTAASDSGSGPDLTNTYKLVFATGATAPADCTGSAIFTGSGTSYSHTGRNTNTEYSYKVCAFDNVGNVSTGATDSATTPSGTPDLDYSSGDDGSNPGGGDSIAGVARSPSGDDSNNLEGGKPKISIEYVFGTTLVDSGGTPLQEPELFIVYESLPNITGDSDPGFFKYALTCTGGTWATGMPCSTTMKLGPSAACKFYFKGTQSDSTEVRLPESGYNDCPSVELINGWGMYSTARDINDETLSGSQAFGSSSTLRWVSTGLDPDFDVPTSSLSLIHREMSLLVASPMTSPRAGTYSATPITEASI
jgi:hypothetical protein